MPSSDPYRHKYTCINIKINKSFKNEALNGIDDSQKKKGKLLINNFKNYSTLLAFGGMQVETTLRFYLTLVRMVIFKKSNGSKCWLGYGERGSFI